MLPEPVTPGAPRLAAKSIVVSPRVVLYLQWRLYHGKAEPTSSSFRSLILCTIVSDEFLGGRGVGVVHVRRGLRTSRIPRCRAERRASRNILSRSPRSCDGSGPAAASSSQSSESQMSTRAIFQQPCDSFDGSFIAAQTESQFQRPWVQRFRFRSRFR